MSLIHHRIARSRIVKNLFFTIESSEIVKFSDRSVK